MLLKEISKIVKVTLKLSSWKNLEAFHRKKYLEYLEEKVGRNTDIKVDPGISSDE